MLPKKKKFRGAELEGLTLKMCIGLSEDGISGEGQTPNNTDCPEDRGDLRREEN